MLVAPTGKSVVDVDQFLGELIEVEPALRIAVDFEPSLADRVDRAIAEIEARPLESGMGSFAKTGLGKSLDQPRTLFASFRVMIDEIRILDAEAELDFAELRRLKPG